MGNCIQRFKWSSRYPEITTNVIDKLELSQLNNLLLKQRYVRIMKKMDTTTFNTTFIYNLLSLFITIGSISVPALLSIKNDPLISNNTNNDVSNNSNITVVSTQLNVSEQSKYIFWITFTVSLLVSISNGIIKLFSIDQTYIIRHLRYNDLRRQGWLFFSLAGPYGKFKTHNEAIKSFMFNIEKIKTNQLIEEFTPETTASKEQMSYDNYILNDIDITDYLPPLDPPFEPLIEITTML